MFNISRTYGLNYKLSRACFFSASMAHMSIAIHVFIKILKTSGTFPQFYCVLSILNKSDPAFFVHCYYTLHAPCSTRSRLLSTHAAEILCLKFSSFFLRYFLKYSLRSSFSCFAIVPPSLPRLRSRLPVFQPGFTPYSGG